MGKTNTEKPTGKNELNKVGQSVQKHSPKKETVSAPKVEKPIEEKKEEEKKDIKEVKKQPAKKVKKDEVSVNVNNAKISTKVAMAICKFVKKKKIATAIEDLEQVTLLKKAVPMKGEIPHRKGKIMSGRFPQKAAKEFIVLLKSLQGNANNHDVENPVVSVAIANIAPKPFARFGRWQRKRTHITLKAKSLTEKKTKSKTDKK